MASWACNEKILTKGIGALKVGSGGEEKGQRGRGTRDPGRRRERGEGRKGSQRAFEIKMGRRKFEFPSKKQIVHVSAEKRPKLE